MQTRREFLGSALAGPLGLVGAQAFLNVGCDSGAGAWRRDVPSFPPLPSIPDRSASAPSDAVALARCRAYARGEVLFALEDILFRIGGIEKLVRNKTVTVKLNITGADGRPMAGIPAIRAYQTHPIVVEAFCHVLARAGARRIVLVESYAEVRRPEEILTDRGFDVGGIQEAGEHRVLFEDTRNLGTYRDYAGFDVPYGGYVFPRYHLNRRYLDTDVLVSMAKLKNHVTAGVTLATKNLFGITPSALYGNDSPNESSVASRGATLHSGIRPVPSGVTAERPMHRTQEPAMDSYEVAYHRVPRITADIASLRPVDLSVVDGVEAVAGSEGPWNTEVQGSATTPRLLAAGRNPVTTDAVCTAVMGYDPDAPAGLHPFPGENHLRLLAKAGIGSNDLSRIAVRGLSLSKALYPYSPGHQEGRWTERFLRGEV